MIRKLRSGEYRLYSRKINPKTGKRRNLGTFKTRAAAEPSVLLWALPFLFGRYNDSLHRLRHSDSRLIYGGGFLWNRITHSIQLGFKILFSSWTNPCGLAAKALSIS